MNIDILIPKKDNFCKRTTQILKQQQKNQSIKARLQDQVYIQTQLETKRITSIWLKQKMEVVQLDGMQSDLFYNIFCHQDTVFVSQNIQQLVNGVQLTLNCVMNDYLYLQVVIICKPEFKKQFAKLQSAKDQRYKICNVEDLKESLLSTITNVIIIGPNQNDLANLSSLKSKFPNIAISAFMLQRNFNISKYFTVGIYKLKGQLLEQFEKYLKSKGQIFVLDQQSIYYHIYLVLLAASAGEKNILFLTNEQKLNQNKRFINNNFQNVQVEDIRNLKIIPENITIILCQVEKPSFLKIPKDTIFIRKKTQVQENRISNQSWTTFNQSSVMNSLPSYSFPDASCGQAQSSSCFFSKLRLKTMEFNLGGSFIRFIFNGDNIFIDQDMLIMHLNYPHPKFYKVQQSLKPTSQGMTVIKPKQKVIKCLVIINKALKLNELSSIQQNIVKYNCVTISFRECQDLDCLQILPLLSQSQILNDYMKHFIITFEFTNQRRYQRFVEAYLRNLRKQSVAS